MRKLRWIAPVAGGLACIAMTVVPLTTAHAVSLPYGCEQSVGQAEQCINKEPVTTTAEFNVTVPTANPFQSYQAAYSLVPLGWTHNIGTVTFFLGPESSTTAGALEGALLAAPVGIRQDIEREIDLFSGPLGYNSTDFVPGANVAIDSASAQCGNQVCERYEEMKYCANGPSADLSSASQNASSCNYGTWRTVAGVFSYDSNGAYANSSTGTQGGDFVDCSSSGGYYYEPTKEDRHNDVSWCGWWRQGPFSDTTHEFMDYGMNVNVYYDGNQYSAWVRMDDYAGCGQVGNRGGAS